LQFGNDSHIIESVKAQERWRNQMKTAELKYSKIHVAIAELLSASRDKAHLTLNEVEDKTKVNRNQLWCYENNTREPGIDELLALFDFYEIDLTTTITMLNELRKK
jgi:predicted transcriptional regulator